MRRKKVIRCECGHGKIDHFVQSPVGAGCGKLNTGGFPCRCEGFVSNKDDIIMAIEDGCKQGGSVPCESILSIIRNGVKRK